MTDIKDRLYTLTTLEKCDIHTSDESVNYEEVNGVMMEYSHCIDCYEKCDERSHHHEWGDWKYLDEQKESRVCKCGTAETRVHIFGELIYDDEVDGFVQVCENCGYKKPQHTHHYGTPAKVSKEDGDPEEVCYYEVSKCECGDELKAPVGHDTYERTAFGKTYVLCHNCDYEMLKS